MEDKKNVIDSETENEEKVEEEIKEEGEVVEESKAEDETVVEEKVTEENEKTVQSNNDNKVRKKKKRKNLFWLIIDAIIVLIVVYFVIGYVNFYKISQDQKPLFEGETSEYVKNNGVVKVNDYKIFKIVSFEIPDQTITYSMKLWFMEDVK